MGLFKKSKRTAPDPREESLAQGDSLAQGGAEHGNEMELAETPKNSSRLEDRSPSFAEPPVPRNEAEGRPTVRFISTADVSGAREYYGGDEGTEEIHQYNRKKRQGLCMQALRCLTCADDGGKVRTWLSTHEFLLLLATYSVGLVNIWRFPYLLVAYGGGTFLLPYTVSMLVLGFPLCTLEISIGQVFRRGVLDVYQCAQNRLAGFGWAAMLCAAYICSYYHVILSWAQVMFVYSFYERLPWCENKAVDKTSFFFREVLKDSGSIRDPQNMQGWVVLSLFASWLIMFVLVARGLRSIKLVSYITVVTPFIVYLILLIIGATRNGAGEGLAFLFTPKWDRVLDFEVWIAAAGHAFFSLGVGLGTVVSFSSYNSKRQNVRRDAAVLVGTSFMASLLAAMVVFIWVGTVAHDAGRTGDIAGMLQDTGIAVIFVAVPVSFCSLPVPQLYCVVFFIILIMFALDSSFPLVHICMVAVARVLPARTPTVIVAFCTCLLGFITGFLYCTYGGLYFVNTIDHYVSSYLLTFLGFFECFLFARLIGDGLLIKVTEELTGFSLWGLRLFWEHVSPFVLFTVFLSYTYTLILGCMTDTCLWVELTYGFLLLAVALLPILMFAIYPPKLWTERSGRPSLPRQLSVAMPEVDKVKDVMRRSIVSASGADDDAAAAAVAAVMAAKGGSSSDEYTSDWEDQRPESRRTSFFSNILRRMSGKEESDDSRSRKDSIRSALSAHTTVVYRSDDDDDDEEAARGAATSMDSLAYTHTTVAPSVRERSPSFVSDISSTSSGRPQSLSSVSDKMSKRSPILTDAEKQSAVNIVDVLKFSNESLSGLLVPAGENQDPFIGEDSGPGRSRTQWRNPSLHVSVADKGKSAQPKVIAGSSGTADAQVNPVSEQMAANAQYPKSTGTSMVQKIAAMFEKK